MKLVKNNILFVKRLEYQGVTYSWYVAMKSRRICDNRQFCNYDEAGRSIIEEYTPDRLPKAVQNFIADHEEWLFTTINKDENKQNDFQTYMIA